MGFEEKESVPQAAPAVQYAPETGVQQPTYVVLQTENGPQTFMVVPPPQAAPYAPTMPQEYVVPTTYTTSHIDHHHHHEVPSEHSVGFTHNDWEFIELRAARAKVCLAFILAICTIYAIPGFLFFTGLLWHFAIMLALSLIGSIGLCTKSRVILMFHGFCATFYAIYLLWFVLWVPIAMFPSLLMFCAGINSFSVAKWQRLAQIAKREMDNNSVIA